MTDSSSGIPAPAVERTTDPADGGARRRSRRWPRWVALGTSITLLAGGGAGWVLYQRLDRNITVDTATADELARHEDERPQPVAVAREAENILLMGSDDRGGENGGYGRDSGTQRSDTTILLHLAADRKSATAVSIPRDLMVDIPDCRGPDGTARGARFAQFNWAFEIGGPACTIRTVENLTGIRVDHHVVVDFTGFKQVVDVLGGVELCLPDPIHDTAAHLDLPAGRQRLDGEQALGYVRARYSLGNGSDTERMGRQQEFLGALAEGAHSSGTLRNPARLYSLLEAVTSSLTTDEQLASLQDLYQLVRGMADIPPERIRFLTAPRQPYALDANRDELVQPEATELFESLRQDRPVAAVEASVNHPQSLRVELEEPPLPRTTPGGGPSGAPDAPSAEGGGTAGDGVCG
ncbi:LCP family protein [Streptomyces sp. TP-A0874]|uniref:LCP family protein n=1 Tax=Streptomyces sp. TP-A0874 TaxID=549819 RepID=UPI0008528FB7|nr:LCP family protein [Streptomyces sp. TP-A0874]